MIEATQADRDAEAAFDRHIVETIGWTKFASMQTAASGAEYGRAFRAGYLARCNQSDLQEIHAAAPELLAALEGALGALEQDVDTGADYNDPDWTRIANERLAAAKAAIAKARGDVA